MVLRNLEYLCDADKIEELRIVVVPGWNDPEDTIRGIAATLGSATADTQLKLIRFRPFGVRGELAQTASPADDVMASLETLARREGFRRVELR